MRYTPAELVAVGHAFKRVAGRSPARDDFRKDSRARLEAQLGMTLPGTHHFLQVFGSWSAYLDTCGFGDDVTSLQAIERAATAHCVSVLGVTEETAERSVTDGWLPDGRTVEIKGSVLRRHSRTGAYFFGFRTHGRELSVSADVLILVGLGRDLSPLVRLEVPKAAMQSLVDGKSNVTVYASAVFGAGQSKYRRFVRWALRMPEAQVVAQFAAEASSES